MNLTEAIVARRAVRSYSPRTVDEQTVRVLLDRAVQAPSAMNMQPWGFAIVQDRAQLQRYSDLAKKLLLEAASTDAKSSHYAKMLRDETFNIFYNAGTLIVICATAQGRYTDADCWLSAQNMMLAAVDMGLATCPIGFAIPVLNIPEEKRKLGIPAEGAAVAPIIVGYPAAAAPPIPRTEPKILSWSH